MSCVLGIASAPASAWAADQTVLPAADGTIADGGSYGAFDGTADNADWSFNESSYEGAITLIRVPAPSLERRVVCEYDLNMLTPQPPVIATLTFSLRGAARFPAQPAGLQVYAYPADLAEQLSDFSASPAVFVAEEFIAPFQPATRYEIDISPIIDATSAAGTRKVAFRFQIDPDTAPDSNQVFMDALDSDPSSKPVITLYDRMPGDFDHDRDVDVDDYAELAICMAGPFRTTSSACRVFDADLEGDVDLTDFAAFLHHMTLFAR